MVSGFGARVRCQEAGFGVKGQALPRPLKTNLCSLFPSSLPRLHRRIFLAGPLAIGSSVGSRLFVAEDLENDCRERRPRTTVSICVDLRFRCDAPRREENLQVLGRLERVCVLVEQLGPVEWIAPGILPSRTGGPYPAAVPSNSSGLRTSQKTVSDWPTATLTWSSEQ